MRSALVTGSFGFVGRHMVKALKRDGWAVGGWDLPSWNVHEMVRPNLHYGPETRNIDLLVHCAYHVGGRTAIDGVNMNFAENLALDAAIFKFAVESGRVGSILYFSSSAVYPTNFQSFGYHQRLYEDIIAPGFISNPDGRYGMAKWVGEKLADDARAHGIPVTIVRPFSGYGADQSDDYPFPSIMKRALKKDLTVWGPPGQARDWIHVSDVVDGALAVWEKQSRTKKYEPVNLCTGNATTMGDLMHEAYAYAHGDFAGPVFFDTDKPTGVAWRVGDPSRMLDYYEPRISIHQGIVEAIDALR